MHNKWIPGPSLYFNRARFYDPVLGRFTSEDPIGYDAGDWNIYSFAWNNPHNWNDASGLAAAAPAQPRAAGGPPAEYAGLTSIEFAAAGKQLQTSLRIACNLLFLASVLDSPDGFTLIGRNGCAGIFLSVVSNPDGRKGKADHQAKVAQLEQECRDRGGTPITEYKVDIPAGGGKSKRFADVYCKEPDGSETLYNVARQTAKGFFVSRVRKALADFILANKKIFLVPP